jgi:hypothetical protein
VTVTASALLRPGRLSVARKLWLAAEIVHTYVRVAWLLTRTDLPDAVQRLRAGTAPKGAGPAPGGDEAVGLRLGRAVTRTLGLMPTDTRCLTQSLVLLRLLARRGIAASVVIGVTTTPAFAAHAWIEAASVPLLPTHTPAFERLIEI